MDYADNRSFVEAHDGRVRYGRDRRYALRLPGETSFTKKVACSKRRNDSLLALLRDDGGLHLARLVAEDRISWVALGKDDLALTVANNAPALSDLGEKGFRIECRLAFGCQDMVSRVPSSPVPTAFTELRRTGLSRYIAFVSTFEQSVLPEPETLGGLKDALRGK